MSQPVSGSKRKVLVVDDDPQIRKILERMLIGPSYDVRTAVDGLTALSQVREDPPDLVILDIMMPGMSGIEVCRQIRESNPEHPIQVLMLSAKDSQADRRRALEYGANDYVTKPFHIASLVRKIQYMFEKQGI
ncbi:response regulator [Deltaproteobacteria bacterium PRO3]|nr:response regulator [Deltaproteobacteria bacterium PRO3]